MFHGVLQLMMLLTLRLVSASLYPTQPIQNTVYYSGQNDGTYPLLSDMGGITIQLYCDSDTYLATLATNLDIPRSVVYDGSNFTLRYITNTPYDMIIYSADFRIVVQGDSLPTVTNANASSVANSTTTSENLFFQATNTPSSSSGPTPSPTNIAIPPLRPGDVGNIDQPSRSSSSSAAGRIDIEKLKFRVVFILWPALLGVTMAL
ncbi:hypothetical protein DFJ58DRAFT_918068 [Suillus subalutaceus]|uniref:uncharacterized protein n=1 Tax=Suillus subalutaceus TaxID=48586 RepID=UPI001B8627E4|nr:uncharacterized protein DFJ58DRAFT_918068 [Suillus subalutaceus]KAG1833634.1 hypothetical protein DFJ58DRAFT_918068 [Suillus subalutaceus]